MKFSKFAENRYQELNMELQTSAEYDARVDCETKAVQQLLTWYRNLYRWILIPKVLWDYFSCTYGFSDEPKPVILNKMRAEKEAAEKAKKEAAIEQQRSQTSEAGVVQPIS